MTSSFRDRWVAASIKAAAVFRDKHGMHDEALTITEVEAHPHTIDSLIGELLIPQNWRCIDLIDNPTFGPDQVAMDFKPMLSLPDSPPTRNGNKFSWGNP